MFDSTGTIAAIITLGYTASVVQCTQISTQLSSRHAFIRRPPSTGINTSVGTGGGQSEFGRCLSVLVVELNMDSVVVVVVVVVIVVIIVAVCESGSCHVAGYGVHRYMWVGGYL